MTGGGQDRVRLSCNLGPDYIRDLRGYQRRKGVTLTEAVERGIAVLVRIAAEQDRGVPWVVTEPDGRSRHVEFMV
jgi:hypothetical protein